MQPEEVSGKDALAPRLLDSRHPRPEVEDTVSKLPIVAVLVVASLATAAPARSQVNVSVNIGQPPPVIVAQPVLVPVQASPVYYAPSYGGGDLFFYGGRYYTVRDDRWFYSTQLNTPWVSIAIGKVPQHILAIPVTYYRVPPGHLKHARGGKHCPPGQAKKGRC